ncbi:porphobilinogen deaminase [Aureobasidium subglaciale]|nr:porphobilinogen deaminase [Aureobasidium subglaciale]
MASEAATSTQSPVNIGTRKSVLARVQTDIVCKELRKAWPDRKYEIHAMSTMGDNNQTTALHEFNAKALWTHELEALLAKGDLDLIVHSLKDMPTQLPPSMSIGCIFPREDARDALVVKPTLPYKSLSQLPEGSVIGTSSVRRSAQLKRLYPGLKFADVRGNVGTRLAKLDNPDGEYTALILAAAGLTRLGMSERITSYLDSASGGILHAVGQGALGIEIRSDDEDVKKLLSAVGCEWTTRACLAERSLMRTLEGGCSVPIGVETEWVRKKVALGTTVGTGVGVGAKPAAEYNKLSGIAATGRTGQDEGEHEDSGSEFTENLIMRALVVSLDGQRHVETEMQRRITSREEADEFGWDVARKLVDLGAESILHDINLNRKIIEEQGDA